MPPIRIDEARLDHAFTAASDAVRNGRIPSAVLGVATGDRVVRVEAFSPEPTGDAAGTPITTDHVFALASISKPITALAAMRLAEQGKLVLSSPVSDVLPEIAAPDKPPITPWHILTHTSGIGEIPWERTAIDQPDKATMRQHARDATPQFLPGSYCEYSTLSYSLLAEMVERITDRPFSDYLRDEVLTPAGAEAIGFDPWALDRPIAPLHGIVPSGVPIPIELAMRYYARLEMPGAGIWADASALLALGQTLLHDLRDGAGTLLSPATHDLMTRLHTGTIRRFTAEPSFPARFGLGWHKPTAPGESVLPGSAATVAHGGATGTLFWVDPDNDLTVVFLTNWWGVGEAASFACIQAVYGAMRTNAGLRDQD